MSENKELVYYKNVKYTVNKGYFKTTYALHRRIWEDHFGEIPVGHHIHHKNGDTLDNRIENLECIHRKKHHTLHFDKEKQLKILHSDDVKKRAQLARKTDVCKEKQSRKSKLQWINRRAIQRICVICLKEFLTKNFTGTKYCSQKCRSASQYKRDRIVLKCILCEREYQTFKKKNPAKTCSPLCSAKYAGMKRRGVLHDFISKFKR